MKKITVTLSDKAEQYFYEVSYGLDDGDGKVKTQSEVINHCLEELSDFEEKMDQDVTGFLRDGQSPPQESEQMYPEKFLIWISTDTLYNDVKKKWLILESREYLDTLPDVFKFWQDNIENK